MVQMSLHFLQNIQYLTFLLIQTTLKELPVAAAGKTEQVNTTDWIVTQTIQHILEPITIQINTDWIATPGTEHIHTHPH